MKHISTNLTLSNMNFINLREDLMKNRALFNQNFLDIFDVARSSAYLAALLDELVLAVTGISCVHKARH